MLSSLQTTMDGHVDESSHVIFLGKFENNKRYKEKIIQEIIAAICAMLNSNGGQVVIHIDTDSNVPVEGFPFSKMSLVIRILEQSMISIIGIHQTVSKMNFKEDKDNIVIFIKKADSLITTNYYLCLPSKTQVVQTSSLESLEKVKDDIMNRKDILEPVQPGSHCKTFVEDKNCDFHECKTVQLKNLKASPSKRTKLADRMIGKSNKFSCYVSAFANYNGGHMYYGIRDDGVVEGELIPNEDISEIRKKAEKTVNKMIWPQQIGEPKRGEHWDIFFESVVDENSEPIPSTYVIVIYIAPCLGGVFTEEPECYEMVQGKVEKMSFAKWKNRCGIVAEVMRNPVSCIQWSSKKIKQDCCQASNVLMELINNGDWKEFERKAKTIPQEFPGREVELIVLSKIVIASSRQSRFEHAQATLNCFCKISTKMVDSPFFEALASYLKIVLKRNQKDFGDIEELLTDALTKAESIEIGCLTAAIHVLVATVSSFKDQQSGFIQDKFCRTAIEHLGCVAEPNSVTRDMKQKAYITLAFSSLKCVLSKDLILDEKCTETDLKEAKSAFTAFNQATLENPPSRYREIQTKLAKSVLHYRQAQVKKEPADTKQLLKCALNFANDAEELAKKLAFDEMGQWSRRLVSECTEELCRTRPISTNQH